MYAAAVLSACAIESGATHWRYDVCARATRNERNASLPVWMLTDLSAEHRRHSAVTPLSPQIKAHRAEKPVSVSHLNLSEAPLSRFDTRADVCVVWRFFRKKWGRHLSFYIYPYLIYTLHITPLPPFQQSEKWWRRWQSYRCPRWCPSLFKKKRYCADKWEEEEKEEDNKNDDWPSSLDWHQRASGMSPSTDPDSLAIGWKLEPMRHRRPSGESQGYTSIVNGIGFIEEQVVVLVSIAKSLAMIRDQFYTFHC